MNEEPFIPTPPTRDAWREARRWEPLYDADPRVSRRPLDYPYLDRSLLASLVLVAGRDPDRSAIVERGVTVTYRELLDLVGRLGTLVAGAHAPPGPMALLLPDGATYGAALFVGIMAGRPCIPLDPLSPAARNADILRDAQVSLILTTTSTEIADLHLPDVATIRIDDPRDLPTAAPDAIRSRLTSDEPAFILATSGSTGRPKLIVHSQRTLAHRANQFGDTMDLTAKDNFLFVGGSFASYAKIAYFLTQLRAGSSTHLINLRTEGIRGLFERLRAEHISVIWAGASLFRSVVGLKDAPAAFAGVRLLRFGGEPVARHDIEVVSTLLPPGCPILNAYGSTETISFVWRASVSDRIDPARVPIGAPHVGADVLLLDDDGRPCPAGTVGELVIRSRYAALGEWRDGGFVTGRLLPDPDDPALRVYFTGDLARQTEDGVIVVLGRKDRMVKINGLRIEPAEIEEALLKLPEVVDATVLPINREGNVMLTAFVMSPGDPPDDLGQRLREALRRSLPSHMIPTRVFVVRQLPRLPSGKVDGQSLLGSVGLGLPAAGT